MIRLTDKQFAGMGKPAKVARVKRGTAPKLSERDTTAQIIGYVRAMGWRPFRLQSGLLRGVKSGFVKLNENGTPDWICVQGERCFFVEMKKTGGKISPAQERWHEDARHCDLLVCVADDLERFKLWMETNL